MTDRELLELAAKAAGIAVLRSCLDDPVRKYLLLVERTSDGHAIGWNPLTDDGDALRLAAKRRICVLWQYDWVMAYSGDVTAREHDLSDPAAAMRRAIVNCAAEIGKGVQP